MTSSVERNQGEWDKEYICEFCIGICGIIMPCKKLDKFILSYRNVLAIFIALEINTEMTFSWTHKQFVIY